MIAAARAAGASHIVAVMSGNFVQRGGPAVLDKFLRAETAVSGGADLVLELPLPYAMATAERFAYGGIALLKAFGCVDMLAFGSECGNIGQLQESASLLNTSACYTLTKQYLESGISYASARQKAVKALGGQPLAALLSSPNNTLAIAYLQSLSLQQCTMQPFTIPRQGAAHDSSLPSADTASASYLRGVLESGGIAAISPFIPSPSVPIFRAALESGRLPFQRGTLDTALLYRLRSMPKEEFLSLPDISEGLGERLYQASRQVSTIPELLEAVRTRRYPLARVRRLLWSAFLGIPSPLSHQPPPYIRILAMNRRGTQILSAAKKSALLPLSASLRDLERLGGECARYAQLESRSTDCYVLGLPTKLPCGTDYRHRLQVST